MEHTQIDFWDTAERLQQDGHSVYKVILAAAIRAREIAAKRNQLDSKTGRLNKYPMKPINTALREFEDEVNNSESE